ncbi:hypothetical protein HOK96_03795 [bacterium]|jgi:hypothetical protein|nr:hypothetical protein [bacterium]MBT3903545.1 hypothetical protein [bacterium]MBT4577605.1 hypothetical protein [bacterium]MBT5346141.1 hypothetical protein [bacterium]MBT6131410.1 hypothetical protein [bacterium]
MLNLLIVTAAVPSNIRAVPPKTKNQTCLHVFLLHLLFATTLFSPDTQAGRPRNRRNKGKATKQSLVDHNQQSSTSNRQTAAEHTQTGSEENPSFPMNQQEWTDLCHTLAQSEYFSSLTKPQQDQITTLKKQIADVQETVNKKFPIISSQINIGTDQRSKLEDNLTTVSNAHFEDYQQFEESLTEFYKQIEKLISKQSYTQNCSEANYELLNEKLNLQKQSLQLMKDTLENDQKDNNTNYSQMRLRLNAQMNNLSLFRKQLNRRQIENDEHLTILDKKQRTLHNNLSWLVQKYNNDQVKNESKLNLIIDNNHRAKFANERETRVLRNQFILYSSEPKPKTEKEKTRRIAAVKKAIGPAGMRFVELLKDARLDTSNNGTTTTGWVNKITTRVIRSKREAILLNILKKAKEENRSATEIQKIFRGHKAYNNYTATKLATTKIENFWIGKNRNAELKAERLSAATTIQQSWKKHKKAAQNGLKLTNSNPSSSTESDSNTGDKQV